MTVVQQFAQLQQLLPPPSPRHTRSARQYRIRTCSCQDTAASALKVKTDAYRARHHIKDIFEEQRRVKNDDSCLKGIPQSDSPPAIVIYCPEQQVVQLVSEKKVLYEIYANSRASPGIAI